MPAARAVLGLAIFFIVCRSKVSAARTLPRHRYRDRTIIGNLLLGLSAVLWINALNQQLRDQTEKFKAFGDVIRDGDDTKRMAIDALLRKVDTDPSPSLAESYKLVVVLNDETNFSPIPVRHYQAGPGPGTLTFWKDMAQVWGNDPQVIFDLYNEPRTSVPTMPDSTLWKLWLDGGTFKGVTYAFGMAHLADYVRNTVGARNLFWIEGPRYSLSFQGMIKYHALINTSGVVYAIHHAQGDHDAQAWNAAFGYLVTDGIAPVVEGEFTNYEPPPDPTSDLAPGYCWANAPTTVPQFFGYLEQLGIGMNAYQLDDGWLIKSNDHPDQPTSMDPATWSCPFDRCAVRSMVNCCNACCLPICAGASAPLASPGCAPPNAKPSVAR